MTTQPARGMRDFLPEDVRRRQYVIGVIADVYQGYGFEPLETPAVENIETLLGKYGEEGDKLIFKILKRGDQASSGAADLALRYDLTVPLARVVAEYRAKLPKFFKRYQVQPVWRADRPQKGRFREFYQCDVDAIGSTSMTVEVELLAAASDVLMRLGFADFTIRLNHRTILAGILDVSGVPPGLHGRALVALDKWDKVGRPGVHDELVARGIPPHAAATLLQNIYPPIGDGVPHEISDARAVVARLVGVLANHPAGLRGAVELQEIVSLTASTSAASRVVVDPALARGLSYYTGAIFEITVPDLAGSLAGGGRYDDLIGMFLGQDVPACGISLGLERILVVMGERDMFPPSVASVGADVMMTIWNAERVPDALALGRELRAAGIRVDVYPEADKLGRQLKYAASRGVPFVIVVGDDEVARGEVAVKNLKTGEQTAVNRAEVAGFIKRLRIATSE